LCQKITGKELNYSYQEENRSGDHIWYISDLSKFEKKYPNWSLTYNIEQILQEIYDKNIERWAE
jgi:CDP-paratose 2-epimerase